jgi:hypothetical protein
MGRVAPLAVALVAAICGVARAEPTHRIRVETTPEGAHVYLDSVESGAKCDATPCEFDAPVGDTSIIIRLDNYSPMLDSITVKRSRDRKPQLFQYKLTPAIATIIVDDKRAAGASIQIDGKDKAKVPSRVEVEPGGHQVVVKLGGKVLYKDFVDVDSGDEKVIDIDPSMFAAKEPTGGDGGGEGSDGGDDNAGGDDHKTGGDSGSGGSITKGGTPSGPRARVVSVAAIVDVGWRRFHYENAPSSFSPNEGEDGQVIAGPAVELWPAELLGWDHLRGLSLYARAEFGINALNVELKDSTGNDVVVGKTAWSSYEGSLRQRWSFDTFAAEASAGYVRDVFQYDDAMPGMLPAADYQALRAGVRAFYVSGAVAPYVAGEARIVFSGGELGNPTQSSATGIRGAAGVEIVGGPIYVRAEAEYLHYEWSYPSDVNTGQPTGASDKIFGFSVSAGYQY